MATADRGERKPGVLAERMIARYTAELADAHPTTDTEIAHCHIIEQLVADWRRRLEAVTTVEELQRRETNGEVSS